MTPMHTLEVLAQNELKQYAGLRLPLNISCAIRTLMHAPVTLSVVPNSKVPTYIGEFLRPIANSPDLYDTFGDLRAAIHRKMFSRVEGMPADQALGWNFLTTLPTGVFVGEAEDLYNLQVLRTNEPIYPIDGFGEKIGDVLFLTDVLLPDDD